MIKTGMKKGWSKRVGSKSELLIAPQSCIQCSLRLMFPIRRARPPKPIDWTRCWPKEHVGRLSFTSPCKGLAASAMPACRSPFFQSWRFIKTDRFMCRPNWHCLNISVSHMYSHRTDQSFIQFEECWSPEFESFVCIRGPRGKALPRDICT